MTGKKIKNVGQRNRYYVRNSHLAIVSAEVFDKVREEMANRARLLHKNDGTVESSASKYNGKYLLGNLLMCGDCGASYRRRTERGKVVWRCATRVENGKAACVSSPTLDEEWIKEKVASFISSEFFDDSIIRGKVERIVVFHNYILIDGKDDLSHKIGILEPVK